MPAQSAAPDARVKEFLMNRKRWTRAEYDYLTEIGFFTTDDKIELLAGKIYHKTRQTPQHTTGICLFSTVLNRVFAEGCLTLVRMPLALSDSSEPEPDLAVVRGDIEDFSTEHPKIAILVAEVLDATGHRDRTTKARIYARANIPEYVIMNVSDKTLEVYRNPGPLRDTPRSYGYAEKTVLVSSDTWTPLAAPTSPIAVADLLP